MEPDIIKTVSSGPCTAEIDEWGGLHLGWSAGDLPDGGPLSLSPEFVKRIEAAREEVLD